MARRSHTLVRLALVLAVGLATLVPTMARTAPPAAAAPLSGVTQLATGGAHACAVKSDSTLWCWGQNYYGQLGLGGSTRRIAPTQLSGTGWSAVATGRDFSCARKTDGTVWCWGSGGNGQLGNGALTPVATPVQVQTAGGPLVGVSALALGDQHACARKTDGTVWCWGANSAGQLGLGDSTQRTQATQLYFAGASGLSAGTAHTCATKPDGTMFCWGANSSGQLGTGTTTPRLTPTQLFLAEVSAARAGGNGTCALKTNGSVLCWGQALLGTGISTSWLAPTALMVPSGLPVPARAHTCIASGAAAWCWGENIRGQLGRGTAALSAMPAPIANLSVAAVSTGDDFSCALKTDTTVACWGYNRDGVLANGPLEALSPAALSVSGITSVATGAAHACGIGGYGTVWCWGENDSGQLGLGDLTPRSVPTMVSVNGAPLSGVAQLSAGNRHSCARKTDGTVWCWGENGTGQLGLGVSSPVPTLRPTALSSSFRASQLSAGGNGTCAAKADGSLWCWGNATYQATVAGSPKSPTQVSGIAGTTHVSMGSSSACALGGYGTVWCWGTNSSGQLGLGDTTSRPTPTMIRVNGNPFAGMVETRVGARHACARGGDGIVWCWGENSNGQLGTGNTVSTQSPITTVGVGYTSLAAGAGQSCATKADGSAWCWGYNRNGELGLGDTADRVHPTQLVGLTGAAQLAAGSGFSCARREDATLACWGIKGYGQLGTGAPASTLAPTPVTL